jgi:hypothetical protein
MTITATYVNGEKSTKKQVLRITSIWGNKATGWNAFVGVYKTPKAKDPYDTFSVKAPYVAGQNPFPALYEEVAKLPFVQDAVSDEIESSFPSEYIIENIVIEPELEPQPVDVPKKKSRAKKNSA